MFETYNAENGNPELNQSAEDTFNNESPAPEATPSADDRKPLGRPKLHESPAARLAAWRAKQKRQAEQIDALAESAAHTVALELVARQQAAERDAQRAAEEVARSARAEREAQVALDNCISARDEKNAIAREINMREAKTEAVIVPVVQDTHRAALPFNLDGLLAPSPTAPPSPVQTPVPKVTLTLEQEVALELEQERITADAAYVKSQERTRLFKIAEKDRLKREWDEETAALLAAREPHPMELTPMEKLTRELERQKNAAFYDSWRKTYEGEKK
jgi:hypothetical protein